MNAIERFEAECDRIAARHRELARARMRGSIRQAVELYSIDHWGLLSWLSRYPVSINFLSTSEASDWLRKCVHYERSLLVKADWKAKPHRFEDLQVRWVVARYFRRFGQRIWSRSEPLLLEAEREAA